MAVMNPSLCIGAQASVFLPPLPANNDISLLLGYKLFDCFFLRTNRQSHGSRYYPTRVSMRCQNRIRYPSSLKAVGTGAGVRKGFGFVSKTKTSLFPCNAALNAKCSQGQTQTITRKSPTTTHAPTHGKEKSPKLDDGGKGFPPRYVGGGGGGGGGGESFSGGFFLFGLLMFMAYLKDLESENDDS